MRTIYWAFAAIIALTVSENPARSSASSGEKTISVTAGGTVVRPADIAYLEAAIGTHGDINPIAAPVPKRDIVSYELKARLHNVGIGERKIRWLSPNRIEVTVDPATNIGHAAASISWLRFIHVIGIRFSLKDGGSAYREAVHIALEDAKRRAQERATHQKIRLGAIAHVDVLPFERAPAPIAFVPFHVTPMYGGFGFSAPYVPIPELHVNASATVTYSVEPI